MAIEVTIPGLGKVRKSTKDLVISSLMIDHPLTLIKITNNIKTKFHASVTFQGVRKAVNQLIEDTVINKNNREYSLSKDWIMELRDFSEQLHDSYFSKSTGIKDIQAIGEEIKVYTFDNLIDLDKFWNKIIGKWFNDAPGGLYAQHSGHTWYVLGQLEEETDTLDNIKKNKIKFYTVAGASTVLDKWCKSYYKKQGFSYTTTKKKADTSRYYAIYNNNIIQTEYPRKLAKEIDRVYSSAKDFESFDVTKLIKLLRSKNELKVNVMKNNLVAEQLRNSILSKF